MWPPEAIAPAPWPVKLMQAADWPVALLSPAPWEGDGDYTPVPGTVWTMDDGTPVEYAGEPITL